MAALTGALGRRYQRRLELLTAAARGEPSVAAAHEAIRVLREVWVPRDGTDTKAMATLVSARPAAYVAAVDAAIAEGAPLVPVPVPRVAGRQESPLERYLRECDQREGVIDGQ